MRQRLGPNNLVQAQASKETLKVMLSLMVAKTLKPLPKKLLSQAHPVATSSVQCVRVQTQKEAQPALHVDLSLLLN